MHRLRRYLLGAARIFDFSGALRDPRLDEARSRSDADALRADWQAVGQDLRKAMAQIEAEQRIQGCVWALFQFVPDPVAGERINIGVAATDDRTFACRFIDDWQVAADFDPDVDTTTLLEEFAASVQENKPTIAHLRQMEHDYWNCIQVKTGGSLLSVSEMVEDATQLYLKRGRIVRNHVH